jgi:hypothetical protein
MKSVKDKWYWKLRRWVKHDLPYLHLEFVRGVKNLWRWFPVIWKDRDWDDHYIYKVLQFKLKNQAEYIGGRGFYLNAKRDAEIMMTCVRLIDKINEEYYGMEYFEYYDYDMSTDNPNRFLEFNVTRDELDTYYAKYPLTFKKIEAEYGDTKDRSSTALLMGDDRQRKARKLLFKILEQNIETWWD